MTQLVEALRYKPEGPVFDSQWEHSNFYCRNMAVGSSVPIVSKSGSVNLLEPSWACNRPVQVLLSNPYWWDTKIFSP